MVTLLGETGSKLVYFWMASTARPWNRAGFSSVPCVTSWSLSKFTGLKNPFFIPSISDHMVSFLSPWIVLLIVAACFGARDGSTPGLAIIPASRCQLLTNSYVSSQICLFPSGAQQVKMIYISCQVKSNTIDTSWKLSINREGFSEYRPNGCFLWARSVVENGMWTLIVSISPLVTSL